MASAAGFSLILMVAAGFAIYYSIRYAFDEKYFVQTQLNWRKLESDRKEVPFDENEARADIDKLGRWDWYVFNGLLRGATGLVASFLLFLVTVDWGTQLFSVALFTVSIPLLISVAYLNSKTSRLTPIAALLLWLGLILLIASFVV